MSGGAGHAMHAAGGISGGVVSSGGATCGRPTSGTMARSQAAHRAPGTTTVPAETWRHAAPCAPAGAALIMATAQFWGSLRISS